MRACIGAGPHQSILHYRRATKRQDDRSGPPRSQKGRLHPHVSNVLHLACSARRIGTESVMPSKSCHARGLCLPHLRPLVFAWRTSASACVPTGLTGHGSFEDIMALSRRLGAGGFLGLEFAWPLHTSGQISFSCTHWCAMQGPFRCQIDECRWGSLQCSTTREVLRDLQIAWSYCRPPFVPPCFPSQHQ